MALENNNVTMGLVARSMLKYVILNKWKQRNKEQIQQIYNF